MVAVSIPALIDRNAARWKAMHLKADKIAAFDATAKRLFENKDRFAIAAQAVWGIPERWWFVAICAEREASGPPNCWTKQLAQGDPLNEISKGTPVGRGPFLEHPGDTPGHDAWLRGAIDALVNCAPYAARWKDWTIGGVLTLWEEYNGLGYAELGVPSAYVFSGSDQYTSGKFVTDHVYRASAIDVQEGCAPLLSRIMLLDSSIKFDDALATPTAALAAASAPPPHPVPAAQMSDADVQKLMLDVGRFIVQATDKLRGLP